MGVKENQPVRLSYPYDELFGGSAFNFDFGFGSDSDVELELQSVKDSESDPSVP